MRLGGKKRPMWLASGSGRKWGGYHRDSRPEIFKKNQTSQGKKECNAFIFKFMKRFFAAWNRQMLRTSQPAVYGIIHREMGLMLLLSPDPWASLEPPCGAENRKWQRWLFDMVEKECEIINRLLVAQRLGNCRFEFEKVQYSKNSKPVPNLSECKGQNYVIVITWPLFPLLFPLSPLS